MRILFIACCLALAVMLSQARSISPDMRRYVGTGLFLGKMNGLSPNNTYSDSEAVSTTPDVNVASETTTMETSSDVTPTTSLSVDWDGNESFGTTDGGIRGDASLSLDGITTVGVVEDNLAIDSSTLTTETTSDNIENVKIIGEASTGVPETTIAVVGGELTATTGSSTDEGTPEGDVSIGLDRTTAATVEDGLGEIGSSSVTTENTPSDTINSKLKEGAFNDQRRTTISTTKVEVEFRATTSFPIAETKSFDLAESRIEEGGSTGLDGTTTAAMVGDDLEAMGSSIVTTENTRGDIVNNEIKGGAFNDVRGKTIATAGVEGEFESSSSPAGDETVSESTGVNTDKVFSDVKVGSQVSSGSAVAGGKQSSDGNLDSNVVSTNSVQAKADEEFISEKSALNVYKLKPINQAAVKASKGKEAVVIYELATAKNKI